MSKKVTKETIKAMTREEVERNREKWLEITRPFIDKKVKLNVRREELLQEMKQLQEDYIKALPVKIGDKVMDEEGHVGWISEKYPYHKPSEKFMRATLGLVFLFQREKEDGTRDKYGQYVYGLPIKL